MADAPVKRLKYFTTQFLVEKDFTDEQSYHRDMRRRHNRFLHSWGVANGFEITHDKTTIEVGPGAAIDKDGNEIVLVAPPIPPLDLKTFPVGHPVYITACYHQEPTDPSDGGTLSTRWTESPEIKATSTKPAEDGAVVLLAEVTLNESGIVKVDQTVRTPAGPRADAVVKTLTVEGDATVKKTLTITGGAALQTTAGRNALDIQTADRTGTHPTGLALYVTGDSAWNRHGVEYRLPDGTQGIGFDGNQIYATGSNANQDLELNTPRNLLLNAGDRVITGGAGGNLQVGGATQLNKTLTVEDIATLKKTLEVDGDATLKKTLTITGAADPQTTAGHNTLDIQANKRTIYDSGTWKGEHPSGLALYVTADSDPDGKGVQFRHSNGTQGIGFGYNTIYATGPYPDQPLTLKAFGTGGTVQIVQKGQSALTVAGGGEALRIIQGVVNKDGAVFGPPPVGFVVTKVAGQTGLYDIQFTPAFPSVPGASATQIQFSKSTENKQPDSTMTGSSDMRDNANIAYLCPGWMRVKTGRGDGYADDRDFTFIVIGPHGTPARPA
jgi:hypothetical protein